MHATTDQHFRSPLTRGPTVPSPDQEEDYGAVTRDRRQVRHGTGSRPGSQQIDRIPGRRTRSAEVDRAPARCRRKRGHAAQARVATAWAQDQRHRPLHLPGRSARSQRDAVLPDVDVRSRALPADRLRPDRRRSLLEIRPHLPPPARHVHLDQAQGPGEGDPAQLAGEGRALHLRHQRRAHPRPGRSRRQRHGHSDRQAAALHRLRRRAAAGAAPDGARFRHQQ